MKFAKLVVLAIAFAFAIAGAVKYAHPQAAQPAPTPQAQTDGPKLTEVEALTLENIKLKYQQYAMVIANARQEQDKLQATYEAIAAKVTKTYPGYVLNTDGTIVKAPPPAPPAKPTPAPSK